jgi:hypothetical protein
VKLSCAQTCFLTQQAALGKEHCSYVCMCVCVYCRFHEKPTRGLQKRARNPDTRGTPVYHHPPPLGSSWEGTDLCYLVNQKVDSFRPKHL